VTVLLARAVRLSRDYHDKHDALWHQEKRRPESATRSIRTVEWDERSVGVVAIDRITGVIRIYFVDGIQRIVNPVLIDRIENVVVALVLVREAGIG